VLADPATRDNQGKDMRILRAPVFPAGPLVFPLADGGWSDGKWPRARMARRNRAFRLSMALVSGMKSRGASVASGRVLASLGRVRGVPEEQLGQADLHLELGARVSTWPPLRLA
jgi:hypothetical protein